MKKLSLILLSLLVSAASPAFASKDGNKLECPVLRPIAQGFLTHHIDARKLDLEHEGRTVERFVKLLDPQKIYLRESDVLEIKTNLRGIFNKLGEDCTAIDKAQKILVKRLEDASVYAKKTLGPDFKFDESTELVFDPNLRKFPATDKEGR